MPQSKVHINLDTFTIVCTAEEIANAFAGLLREMRTAAPFLQAADRAALRKIMSADPEMLIVDELFSDFERDSDTHLMLRRLRTAQFIRPADRDRWDRDSHIEIKPFARLVWDQLGEAGIFGDVRQSNPREEEIDLSLPGVNEPDEMETVRAKNTKEIWEDDDVLDFLKDAKAS